MSYVCSVNSTTCYSVCICPYAHTYIHHTGDALNLPEVLAGAVVAFLLLTLLTAGIIVGAMLLGRKAHKKRLVSQSKAPQQKGGITSKAGKKEESTEVHTNDVVSDDASIESGTVKEDEGTEFHTMMSVTAPPLTGEWYCTRS